MEDHKIFFKSHGFILDEKLEVLKQLSKSRCKTLSIDAYKDKPFVLLLRTMEKGCLISIKNNRFVIHRNDKQKTTVVNVPYNELEQPLVIKDGTLVDNHDEIKHCMVKQYSDCHFEILFELFGIKYKLWIKI